jgi:hypothetical protein
MSARSVISNTCYSWDARLETLCERLSMLCWLRMIHAHFYVPIFSKLISACVKLNLEDTVCTSGWNQMKNFEGGVKRTSNFLFNEL